MFSKRIKQRREKLGLSIKQVSEMINEPASSYLDWENGRKITGEKVYSKLCIALGFTLNELIIGESNQVSDELEKIENIIEKIRLLI